jgi:hypothetical protein
MPRGDAEQKRRQRARNGTDAGSSGVTKVAGAMTRKSWEDVEDIAEHIGDLQVLVSAGQLLANRGATATLVASREWAHEMVDVHLGSQGKAVFARFYAVPLSAVLDREDPDA